IERDNFFSSMRLLHAWHAFWKCDSQRRKLHRPPRASLARRMPALRLPCFETEEAHAVSRNQQVMKRAFRRSGEGRGRSWQPAPGIARSMQSEEHRSRERALRRGNGIEQSERQPARPANERKIVAEDSNQTVRESDAGHAIDAACARVA